MEEQSKFMAPPPEEQPSIGTMGRIGQDQEVSWRNFICMSSHPVAAFFHLVFKAAAITLYVFSNWFGFDFVTAFVLVILFLAFDFWVVKNVSGRLLVGLRWWVQVKEDGSNEWLFESSPTARVPTLDYRIFWWALYGAPIAFFALGLSALLSLSLSWMVVDAVGLALTGANLMGYMKCSSDAQGRLQSALTGGAMAGLAMIPGGLPTIGTTLMSIMAAGAAGSAAAAAAAPKPAPAAAAAAPRQQQQQPEDEHSPFGPGSVAV